MVEFGKRGVTFWRLAFEDHVKTTASCALLFRDATAMLVKPTMGHSLQGHPKFETPLVGSVDAYRWEARAQKVVQPFFDDPSVTAPSEHGRDVR